MAEGFLYKWDKIFKKKIAQTIYIYRGNLCNEDSREKQERITGFGMGTAKDRSEEAS